MNAPLLVIDDSLTIRKLLEMALGRQGHALEVAACAGDGLALAQRLRPRLILLDQVLPDLSGDQVCLRLAADERTAGIPIVVMSAKGEGIRPLFRACPAVVAFVAKPFTPGAISEVVAQVLARLPAEAASALAGAETVELATPTATPLAEPGARVREEAARAAFSALRDRLARIPEWCGELRGQSPAAFFARKLLTPESMGALLGGLAPLLSAGDAPPAAPGAGGAELTGSTGLLPLPRLVRVLAESGRSGALQVGGATGLRLFFSRGELLLCVPGDPAEARRAAAAAGLPVPTGAAPDGVPELVAWVEAAVPAADCPALLQRLGAAALVQRLGQGPLPFAWADGAPPAFATRVGLAIAAEQLDLERLRLVDDWAQLELQVTSLDLVCARAPDFLARLPRFSLDALEHRVLLQVNGRNRVKDLIARLGLSTFDAFHALYRLLQVQLIQPLAVEAPAATLLVCAAAEAGLTSACARLLHAGGEGHGASVSGCAPAQAEERLATGGATLALVDVTAPDAAAALALALRARLETSATTLVALLPHADGAAARALLAAGFDHVLARPLHRTSLQRLMNGRTGA